ncbi:MAG: hypothetical protein IH606_17005 [Burkholderiales bacterium]|nr:hypothetical protein [Burkholderiales bacterium]
MKTERVDAPGCDVRAAHPAMRCAAALLAMLLAAQGYAAPSIGISSPQSMETVHDNSGRISVSVKLGHAQDLRSGFALQALVDGRAVGGLHKYYAFTLDGIDRGTHTLQVQLLGRDGEVLAISGPVEFYLRRASRLFPNRQ